MKNKSDKQDKRIKDHIINKGTFIALSDFHSFSWPLNKIKDYYLKEYDHIYILGDATDRGPDGDGHGGIDLIIEIMNLCITYPNRVHYLPGNHDSFLYNFMDSIDNSRDDEINIIINGGSQTIIDLDKLYQWDNIIFNNLLIWLRSQPLQVKHIYNGKTYCLAHALFNQKVYEQNPVINLYDYRNSLDFDLCDDITNMIWYRNNYKNYYYKPDALPLYDEIMVVGHTPKNIRPDNIDLVRDDGSICKVVCVDAGINQTKLTMFKYDGNGYDVLTSNQYEHISSNKSFVRKLKYKIKS